MFQGLAVDSVENYVVVNVFTVVMGGYNIVMVSSGDSLGKLNADIIG